MWNAPSESEERGFENSSIYHHLANRVKAHVFLCVLSYYVEWHMRRALAPMLFDDDDPQTAEAARKTSSVRRRDRLRPRAKMA